MRSDRRPQGWLQASSECVMRDRSGPSAHAAFERCLCPFTDLFAILKTTEKLERAWTRDLVSAKEYEPLCVKLIAQFKTLWGTLRDSVSLWQLSPV